MNPLTRTNSVLALCGLLHLAGCAPDGASARVQQVSATRSPKAAATTQTPAKAGSSTPNNDCWYFELGEHELVAVWVSPRLPGQVPGGFRLVNLIYHDPTAKKPILLHSTPAHSEQSYEVAMRSGSLSFSVTPRGGKTWSQVETREHLRVDLNRP